MAECSESGEDPKSFTGIGMNTGTNFAEFVMNCNDYRLFQFTTFYQDRLEQAIEEGIDGISSLLTYSNIFSGCEHQQIIALKEKRNPADSSKLFLSLVMEKGCHARRVMWQSFVQIRKGVPKLDKLLENIETLGNNPIDHMDITRRLSEIPTDLKDVQQIHKEMLRKQTETLRVNTILLKEKVKNFQLVDRYTELTLISAVRDRKLVEHELLSRGRKHEEWREKHLRRELEKIRMDQLFQSSFYSTSWNSGRSAAVSGVPGIGKTTMVQKIIHDWATGKIYPQFQFVFSFKFRELNTVNCKINLKNLILNSYPYLCHDIGSLLKSSEGLLFIFDGLDEFKETIDFSDNRVNTEPRLMCTDPECCCEVSDIVYSLIWHKLLPGSSMLVTSRPTELHLLEKAEISVWAEILGFVGEEWKRYFNKFFEDQVVAAAVCKYVEENVILHTMCYNPSYCWILGLSLSPFFMQQDWKQQQVPKTITQLYSNYIYNILKHHCRDTDCPRDVLMRLGQMAFTGVSEKKIVFRTGDLIQHNLQHCQFLSGFLMELLERDDSTQNVVYTFPHLTIQEFVAALAQFLYPGPGNIVQHLSECHSKTDGRFEIFLRFVAGLSSPQSARLQEEILGQFCLQTTWQVIDWVKTTIEDQMQKAQNEAGKRNLLSSLHYLFECQNKALAQSTVGSMEVLNLEGLRLTPMDCTVLSHVLKLCDVIQELHLKDCCIQNDGLQRLASVLPKCRILSLRGNNLGDPGVKFLSNALRHLECKIENLWLDHNCLTDAAVEELTSAIVTNQSLKGLNLNKNKLGDSGMKQLAVALKNPKCTIQELGLEETALTFSCVEDLNLALAGNQSLINLSLSKNNLEASGLEVLSTVLRNPNSRIERLHLDNNCLMDNFNEDICSTLITNHSLREVNLDNNKLGDSGIKLLSAALKSQNCNIQKLQLWNNSLTDSCAVDLSSALSANHSLMVLNLGSNKLGDSGVKLLSAALRNPDCNIQELRLWNNDLTDSCVDDIASVLSSNRSLTVLNLGKNPLGDLGVLRLLGAVRMLPCKLKELQLSNVGITDCCTEDLTSALGAIRSLVDLSLGSNSFTDRAIPYLRNLILSCKNLEHVWLKWNKFSSAGLNELKSLRESRPGLRVLV